MAKRKLVEIEAAKHHELEIIRTKCRKANRRVPTIPMLVDRALALSIPQLGTEYLHLVGVGPTRRK